MTLKTQRLELLPLDGRQLTLWTQDTSALERELNVSYSAEPLESAFLEIVRGQQRLTKENGSDYLWHTF